MPQTLSRLQGDIQSNQLRASATQDTGAEDQKDWHSLGRFPASVCLAKSSIFALLFRVRKEARYSLDAKAPGSFLTSAFDAACHQVQRRASAFSRIVMMTTQAA